MGMNDLEKRSIEKLPPFNLEAEQAILCSCLLNNDVIFDVLDGFEPADFYRPGHRKIFSAMFSLADDSEPVDLLTLRDRLLKDGTLEDVGDVAYLVTLADAVPTAANVKAYAKIVHDKAIIRRLLNTSIETATRCWEDRDSSETLLNDHEQKILAIAEGRASQDFASVEDISAVVAEDVERRAAGDIPTGLSLGWTDLDGMLAGVQRADLVVVAARPAMGKTSFALNMAAHLSDVSPGAVFSLEMSKEQLVLRLHCSEGRINSKAAKSGKMTDGEWDRYTSAVEVTRRKKIYIDDSAGLTVQELRAKARRLKREKGIEWIVIDYLQLMDAGIRTENRNNEVAYISRQVKKIAKELNIPVFLLSQLSRKCEERHDKRPMLSDLRDSGAIEQDADIVMFLYRGEVYNEDGSEGIAEVIVSKHRNGETGTAQLAFVPEYTRFENLNRQHFPNMGQTF